MHDGCAHQSARMEIELSKTNAIVCTRTNWKTLSPTTKALIEIFAASPIWGVTEFRKPPADLLNEILAAAWNRAGFCEDELRKNPETVVGALKKIVMEQLRTN